MIYMLSFTNGINNKRYILEGRKVNIFKKRDKVMHFMILTLCTWQIYIYDLFKFKLFGFLLFGNAENEKNWYPARPNVLLTTC